MPIFVLPHIIFAYANDALLPILYLNQAKFCFISGASYLDHHVARKKVIGEHSKNNLLLGSPSPSELLTTLASRKLQQTIRSLTGISKSKYSTCSSSQLPPYQALYLPQPLSSRESTSEHSCPASPPYLGAAAGALTGRQYNGTRLPMHIASQLMS